MPTYLDEINGVLLSEAIAEAAASAPINRVALDTYEIKHPSFTDGNIYIVNDYEPFTAALETGQIVEFVPCPVDIISPEESDSAQSPSLAVKIDGVSSILIGQLDNALASLEKIEVVQRLYASDDTSGPASLPPLRLVLTECSVSETTVTATAGLDDPVNRGFPRKDYLSTEYPGLGAR